MDVIMDPLPAEENNSPAKNTRARKSLLKANACTQTLSVDNLVRQVLISKVADGLQDKGLELIACAHTRGLLLTDITNDLVNRHSASCAQMAAQEDTHVVSLEGDWLQEMFEPPRTKPKKPNKKTVKKGEEDKKCHICGKTFRYPALVKYHMTLHTKDKPFKCNQCEYMAKDHSSLRKHTLFIHKRQYPYHCKYCCKGYSSKGKLTQHENTHLDYEDFPFRCNKCDKNFSNKKNFKAHSAIHDKSKWFYCDLCPKTFKYWAIFQDHLKKKHGAVRQRKHMLCLRCDLEFDTWPILLKHMKDKHDGETFHGKVKVMCYFCPATYTHEKRRIEHMRICHNVQCSIKESRCMACNIEYNNRSAVIEHMKTNHQECLRPPPHVQNARKERTLETKKAGFLLQTTEKERWESKRQLASKRLRLTDCQEAKSTDDIRKCILSQKCWLCDKQLSCYTDVLDHVKTAHPNTDTTGVIGAPQKQKGNANSEVEPSSKPDSINKPSTSSSTTMSEPSSPSPTVLRRRREVLHRKTEALMREQLAYSNGSELRGEATGHPSQEKAAADSKLSQISVAVSKDNVENFKKSVQKKQCWICGTATKELKGFLKHMSDEHKDQLSGSKQGVQKGETSKQSSAQQEPTTSQSAPENSQAPSQIPAPKGLTTDQSSAQKDQISSQSSAQKDPTTSQSAPESSEAAGQDQTADQSPTMIVIPIGQSQIGQDAINQSAEQTHKLSSQLPVLITQDTNQSAQQEYETQVLSPCDFCPVMLSPSKMTEHLKDVHNALISKECKKCLICKLEFKDWPRLVRHIKAIHKEHSARQARKPEAVNRCWLCQAEFNQSTSLVAHMKQFHNLVLQVQTL